MSERGITFNYIENEVRKKTFGILSTVTPKGHPHQVGMIYAVSHPESPFRLYMGTGMRSRKAKNIQSNSKVSFLVTFPHYYLRMVPSYTATFRGKADFVSFEDNDVQWAFNQKMILRMNFDVDPELLEDLVIIRIKPTPTVNCYGLGIGLNEIRKSHATSFYNVKIPQDRL